ncbi:MFS transporter [Methanobacterium sp.]|jgi:EmrB/QacA subfamily drug resistance transporter|uniref:MFS transporter n=1 Tax=Methanobacterium sp. TaxID=2164 RepID=UPI003159784D
MDSKQRNRILALLFVGVFMGALDIGIVGPVLPAVKSFFAVNDRAVSWIFTIYILFFMIGTPLMAKISDVYGRRNIYIIDIFLFAAGSVITAFSSSFEIMILGRAIQGFGAGGIFPVASAFIGDTFPPEKRGSALGIIGSVFGLSAIFGPILGGLLLNYGWQWLFIINIPIAAGIIAAGYFILPKTKRKWVSGFDWYGTLVLGILVASLAFGVNQIDSSNFTESLKSLYVWPFLLCSIALLPVLWRIEKGAEDPVIQINLLKNREVRLATGISIGSGLSQVAIIFLPSFAVISLSLSTSTASLMILPLVITMAISAPLVGKLLDKFGSKKVMFTGSFILIAGLFILSFFAYSFYIFILAGLILGVGLITIIGAPLRYIMLSESPEKYRASGQALININASAGQLVGGALVGGIIASKGGTYAGYEFAYIAVGIAAVIMLFLTVGLKGRLEQVKTMKMHSKS